MKRFLSLVAVLAIAACGKDASGVLGPPPVGEWDHTCDQKKLDLLHQYYGADYSPTWQLMEQPAFYFQQIDQTIHFNAQNGQCVTNSTPGR